MDEVIVHAKDKIRHDLLLEEVFMRFKRNDMRVNPI
jgi:hypothetical protein